MEREQILNNERLDRMEQHLKLMRVNIDSISDNSKKISDALIGNEYTGGIGIVHSIKELKEDNLKTKDKVEILENNMAMVKWFGSGIGGLVLAIILYIIQKQLD